MNTIAAAKITVTLVCARKKRAVVRTHLVSVVNEVMEDSKKKTRIVILGAGFAGVYVYKYLHSYSHRNPCIELFLVDQNNYFLFTPLLHEVASGSMNPSDVVEPLGKVFGCCVKNFFISHVKKVYLREKYVETQKEKISYDYLVMALGSKTNFYGVPGAYAHSYVLKTLSDAIRLKNHCIDMLKQASAEIDQEGQENFLRFFIVGAGPTGVELACELSDFLYMAVRRLYGNSGMEKKIHIKILDQAERILPELSLRLQKKIHSVLARKKISLSLGVSVAAVEKESIILASRKKLEAKTIIWVGGVEPILPEFDSEVKQDKTKRLLTQKSLQLAGYGEVFCLGDMAAIPYRDGNFVPAQAQAAVDEARVAAKNIIRSIGGKKVLPFIFRPRGFLLSLGKFKAAGEVLGFNIFGFFSWFLWRGVYWTKFLSLKKRVSVGISWFLNLFSSRDTSQL